MAGEPFEELDYPVVAADPLVIAPRDKWKKGPYGGREYLHARGIEVQEPFATAYDRLGGPNAYLGLPTSNRYEPGHRGAGEVQDFEGGALLLSKPDGLAYGMSTPLYAYWRHHLSSYPIADEEECGDDGRFARFGPNGGLYWWPALGADYISGVRIAYTGLACFGTTDGVGDDEPYLFFTVEARRPGSVRAVTSIVRTRIYEDVSARTGVTDTTLAHLYQGELAPMWLMVELYEHDAQSPDDLMQIKQSALARAPDGIARMGEFEESLIGDDLIASWPFLLRMEKIVEAARAIKTSELGVSGRLFTPLMSGQGASYKVCFDVTLL